jgi:hypothetical protein
MKGLFSFLAVGAVLLGGFLLWVLIATRLIEKLGGSVGSGTTAAIWLAYLFVIGPLIGGLIGALGR